MTNFLPNAPSINNGFNFCQIFLDQIVIVKNIPENEVHLSSQTQEE